MSMPKLYDKIKFGFVLIFCTCLLQEPLAQNGPDSNHYFFPIIKQMEKKWPNNQTVNFVFHGHSVPSGYLTRGVVDRLNAYPFKTLKHLNKAYPYSVLNVITTSIGGEQSEQGALRMQDEVLNHRPDVLFIDYGLNDRSIGLERSKKAWKTMIESALAKNVKVVLLTPTPDLTENILDDKSALESHSEQIRTLAEEYDVALVDAYKVFKNLASDHRLEPYMAQNNHINEIGHEVVATLIFKLFTTIR